MRFRNTRNGDVVDVPEDSREATRLQGLDNWEPADGAAEGDDKPSKKSRKK